MPASTAEQQRKEAQRAVATNQNHATQYRVVKSLAGIDHPDTFAVLGVIENYGPISLSKLFEEMSGYDVDADDHELGCSHEYDLNGLLNDISSLLGVVELNEDGELQIRDPFAEGVRLALSLQTHMPYRGATVRLEVAEVILPPWLDAAVRTAWRLADDGRAAEVKAALREVGGVTVSTLDEAQVGRFMWILSDDDGEMI